MTALFIGTSGWSYPSWRPDFYPAGLANEDFLGFYAERFRSVELNSTGYRLPSEEQFVRWAAMVPDGFRFAVKASPQALRSFGTFEERVRMLGDRLGACESSSRARATTACLPSCSGRPISRWHSISETTAGTASTSARRCASTTRRATRRFGIAVSVSRRTPTSSSTEIATGLDPLLESAAEVFAYFQHEDAPTAPAYAARLLELVRADER